MNIQFLQIKNMACQNSMFSEKESLWPYYLVKNIDFKVKSVLAKKQSLNA